MRALFTSTGRSLLQVIRCPGILCSIRIPRVKRRSARDARAREVVQLHQVTEERGDECSPFPGHIDGMMTSCLFRWILSCRETSGATAAQVAQPALRRWYRQAPRRHPGRGHPGHRLGGRPSRRDGSTILWRTLRCGRSSTRMLKVGKEATRISRPGRASCCLPYQSRDSRSEMPESSTGGRSGNVAISERLPSMASTARRSADSSRSLRCSRRETPS